MSSFYLSRFFSAVAVFVHSGCEIDRWTCDMPTDGIRYECCDCGGRLSKHNSNEISLSDGCIDDAIKSVCFSCACCSFGCECGSLCFSTGSADFPLLAADGFCRISKIFRISRFMLTSILSNRDVSSVICVVIELCEY